MNLLDRPDASTTTSHNRVLPSTATPVARPRSRNRVSTWPVMSVTPVLCLSCTAEHPLEDHSPAQQGNGPVVGRCRDRRSGCGQFVQHVWHFVLQHLDDLPAEGVGMVELHDSPAPPRGIDARGRRSRIAVDHEHVVPAPGQRDRGEQTGRARPDDDRFAPVPFF